MNSLPAQRTYLRYVWSVVRLALVGSCLALGTIGASLQTDDADVEKLIGCWISDRVTQTPGKCPIATKDAWHLCFSPTMAGWVQGSLTANHTEMLDNDQIARDDALHCFTAAAPNVFTMLHYDVSVTRSPKNELVLSETHHKCALGDCSKALKTSLSGKLTIESDTLTFTRADASKVVFKKNQEKK